jgi:ubiquinone/menaquinone biosynthesis C-methylase UbiE
VPVDVRTVPSAQMNLPPASVDAVVSVYGLSSIAQGSAVLKEAARVLKPGKVSRGTGREQPVSHHIVRLGGRLSVSEAPAC